MKCHILAGADTVLSYYDMKRSQWAVLVRNDDLLDNTHFATQAEANAYVGISGGSREPTFVPEGACVTYKQDPM